MSIQLRHWCMSVSKYGLCACDCRVVGVLLAFWAMWLSAYKILHSTLRWASHCEVSLRNTGYSTYSILHIPGGSTGSSSEQCPSLRTRMFLGDLELPQDWGPNTPIAVC